MYTRERRQLRLFVRRDIYGRFLSCLVYLPRDRYNTTVRERIAAILKEQLDGDSIEYTAHVGESFAARLHFVVRPAPGEQIGEPDMRRPRAPLRRGGPVLARRLHRRRSSRRTARSTGSRSSGTYAGCFPEAYKEDYPPQTGAVDLGRLEEIEGDDGHRAVALRGRRRAARRGPAEGLPDRAAAVAVRGAADPLDDGRRGRRRAALPARGAGAGVLHLRLRAALPPARCPTARASCSRTPSRRSGTATTRATASTRWCSPPG